MPMRKYHFNGPHDIPRFIAILLALVVIAFAGTAILTVMAFATLGALLPLILWDRLVQFKRWVARSLLRRKEA